MLRTYKPKMSSMPTVSPGRELTARTPAMTPGMNETRSSESWRMVSDSPSAPNSTSWCATSPRSRTPCTWMPSIEAPRAPGSSWTVASGGGGRPADAGGRHRRAVVAAVPTGRQPFRHGGARRSRHFRRTRRLLGEVHHQHRTDGEVGGDQDADCRILAQLTTDDVVLLVCEAGGSDDSVNAVLDAPGDVVHHRIGMGEVDGYVGGLSHCPVVAQVEGRNQLQPIRGFHRYAYLGAHPASGPEHSDLHVLGHEFLPPPGRALSRSRSSFDDRLRHVLIPVS